MKKQKRLIYALLVVALTGTMFISCGKNESNETNKTNSEAQQLKENYTTYEEVKEDYNYNLQKIMNNEQIRELDMMNIKLDNILEYANKSKVVADTVENSSDKIDVVTNLVALDDLQHNTTQDAMTETIKYVIEKYENSKYESDVIQFLYLTRYLDKRLDNHTNMKNIDDMIFDMYQIAEDTIRVNSANTQEELKSELIDSIEANKEQINKNITIVKESL